MKVTACIALVVLALSVAWMAGEKHRENCERNVRVSCSVLPWDTGEPAPPPPGVLLRDGGSGGLGP